MIFKKIINRFINNNTAKSTSPNNTILKQKSDDEEYTNQQVMKVRKYTNKISDPSKDFSQFLTEYFTGHPMIRGRSEEDISVWERLKDDELEIAKQMILDNLGHDTAYIRAIGVFRDDRGIPLLKNLIETLLDNNFAYIRLYSAKVLYDWIGYTPYLKLLESILPNDSEFTKINLDFWIRGIEKTLATHYIFLMLRDENSFVRWCAYDTYKQFFNLGVMELHEQMRLGVDEQKKLYEENKHYTSDDVYSNKKLFESRIKELENKIQDRHFMKEL